MPAIPFPFRAPFSAALLLLSPVVAGAAEDIVFSDFEGDDFRGWTVQGTAFGQKPAAGAVNGQMHVEGFSGRGFANSFHGGDDAKGVLTSAEFTVSHPFISFLIGGGGFAGKTCINLKVNGRTVRTAEGPNTTSGGSERLALQGWNVDEFAGKTAKIEIVDDATGGWGHINIDHIVFTEKKPPLLVRDITREITLDERYLLFPVRNGAPKHRVAVLIEGKVARDFEIELAEDPSWMAHLDAGAWRGKKAVVRVDRLPEDSAALAGIVTSENLWKPEEIYHEPERGQFHFSAKRGWLNDPNGMVFARGEYHLFFQHNPYGREWGNMHWGHAVSRDLVRWEELPVVFYPPVYDDMAFSGSAVVDRNNTSGWKTGENDLLVAAFTSTGRGECVSYSNDLGRTWKEYEGNPVVKHQGRDPRLFWHEPTKRWIMATYTEDSQDSPPKRVQDIAFYTSPNLREWTYASRISGFFECPDIFELPVDGDPGDTKWVLTAADSRYRIGSFDGKTFTPETDLLPGHRGREFYAAQTFSDEPKGRRIQIGWMRAKARGNAFSQYMSLPLELTLRRTPAGPRLAWKPVEELRNLRVKSVQQAAVRLDNEERPVEGADGELLEVRAVFKPGETGTTGFIARGIPVAYDAAKRELAVAGHRAPAGLEDGKLALTVYVDRNGVEVFTGDGLTYMPVEEIPKPEAKGVSVFARGGAAECEALEVHELRSIWR